MGNKLYRLINNLKNFISNYIKKYNLKELFAKNINKASLFSKQQIKNIKTNGVSKKQTIVIASALVLSIIVLLIPNNKPANPTSVLESISYKIKQGDVKTIKKNIAVNNIAEDMAIAITQEIKTENLTEDLINYIKSELKKNIENDFYSIVANKGDFKQNIKQKNAVLSKFTNYLLNDSGRIIKTEITDQDNNKATLNITIFRPDLNEEITVKLRLKSENNAWKVIKIIDLKQLLNKLEVLESKRIDMLNSEISQNFNRFVVLKDFQKSDLNTKTNSFLIRLSLENISDENIKSIKAKLELATTKQIIGSININVNETIAANNFYEKAWSIKLNDIESLKSLAKISSKNINANLKIEEIVFEKGNALKLIK